MQNQNYKCSICNCEYPEDEITYKEDDVKKVEPICHNCLGELFEGNKQLDDNMTSDNSFCSGLKI